MKGLDISMILHNSDDAFVSQDLARKIAYVILEDKYPQRYFTPMDFPVIADAGNAWKVTFVNKLMPSTVDHITKQITITIQKKDAAILSISR